MVVGELSVETDLVVIGGGPAGVSTALRAAELGIETTVIDARPALGGSWLDDAAVHRMLRALRMAQSLTEPRDDRGAAWPGLTARQELVRRMIAARSARLAARCEAAGITHVQGRARFDNSRQLSIQHNPTVPRIKFKRAVIATGARSLPPSIEVHDDLTVSPEALVDLPELPARLLVVGSGARALEAASLFAEGGSRVTLASESDRLLPAADPDLTEHLRNHLEQVIDTVRQGMSITEMRPRPNDLEVVFRESGETMTVDRILFALGSVPNLDGLELARTRATLDDEGFIQVDAQMRTTDPRIFAVGDVVGERTDAGRSIQEGCTAAEVIAGRDTEFDSLVTPEVVQTDPPIAWCGMTEADAAAAGQPVQTVWSPDHARIGGDAGGEGQNIARILYDPESRLLLGAGAIGPGAAEIIATAALAIEMGAVLADVATTIHPHRSACESLNLAAQHAERASSR